MHVIHKASGSVACGVLEVETAMKGVRVLLGALHELYLTWNYSCIVN